MNIFNKKKYQQKITNDFYYQTRDNVKALRRILNNHGAAPYIEKDKDRFFIYSFFFLTYFQDIVLYTKYGNKYNTFATVIINTLIIEFSERIHYIPDKMTKIYLQIRNQLAEAAFDKRVQEVGLYYGIACHYLIATLPKEFDPDDASLYYELANFFQSRVNKNTEYLSAIN